MPLLASFAFATTNNHTRLIPSVDADCTHPTLTLIHSILSLCYLSFAASASTQPAMMGSDSPHLATTDELSLIAFLSSVGAFDTRHSSHYTLASHLLGTYGVLRAVSAPHSTAVAGALHSLYGTIRFPCALLDSASEEHRKRVRGLFGEQAELLAHTFCTINRPVGLEHLDQTTRRRKIVASPHDQQQPPSVDHNQGRTSLFQPLPAKWDAADKSAEVEAVQLDAELVHQLRLLDAANMIEQGEEHTTLTRLPTISRVWKEHIASVSQSPPPPSDPTAVPLFAHFFHFIYQGCALPCVKLSSGVVAPVEDLDGFHQQLLQLIAAVDSVKMRHGQRITSIRLHAGGLTGEVEATDGCNSVEFSADSLRLLASNPPNLPYELLLSHEQSRQSLRR